MLNLRMMRGPLTRAENSAILAQYNQLTSARIPIEEFEHWVQNSPEGPAWHAILESDEGQIVGHTSFLPFRSNGNGKKMIPAKSEYTFLREEFRATRIRDFEKSGKPTWLIFADQLHKRCTSEGWGPLFVSTTPVLHRFFASVGCQRTDFPLWECLLVLRPWNAARDTPNLQPWQRILLGGAGTFQSSVWSILSPLSPHSGAFPSVPIDVNVPLASSGSPTFFEEPDFLRWRYSQGQYERLALDAGGQEYVIVKKGLADRYLRVCQWRVGSGQPTVTLINRLVRMAKEDRALGVRWAFYGNDRTTLEFVGRIRKLGFFCAQRVRTLLAYPKEQHCVAENWRLNDAMFSFDP